MNLINFKCPNVRVQIRQQYSTGTLAAELWLTVNIEEWRTSVASKEYAVTGTCKSLLHTGMPYTLSRLGIYGPSLKESKLGTMRF